MRDLPGELARAKFLRDYYAKVAAHLEDEIAGASAKEASQPSPASAAGDHAPEARRPHAWLKVD